MDALSDITILRDLLKEGGPAYKQTMGYSDGGLVASGDPFVGYNNIENYLENKQNI